MVTKPTTSAAYTLPEISIADPNDWFVFFRYSHEGVSYLRKKRDNLNRIKDKVERMQAAEQSCKKYTDWLKEGWNPVVDADYKVRQIKPTIVRKAVYLREGLTFALGKKKLATKSRLGYHSMLEFILLVAKQEGYDLLPLAEYDRGLCLSLIDQCAKVRSFTNHNYNKHVALLRSLLGELVHYNMLLNNPLTDVREKEVPESNKFADYTTEEKRLIYVHLNRVHPQLLKIMLMVYHTGIRPKEVLALRVGDIDLDNLQITIAPEEGTENSKTLKVRRVPVNPHLAEALLSMHLNHYPKDYYAFGAPLERNRGSVTTPDGRHVFGVMRPDYLKPQPHRAKRDTVTKLWKKLVMDDPPIGLGIKKYLYAAKHTGTDDKTDAGLEISEIQVLYGHASQATTIRYNKRKKENEAKQSIMQKSPTFVDRK